MQNRTKTVKEFKEKIAEKTIQQKEAELNAEIIKSKREASEGYAKELTALDQKWKRTKLAHLSIIDGQGLRITYFIDEIK